MHVAAPRRGGGNVSLVSCIVTSKFLVNVSCLLHAETDGDFPLQANPQQQAYMGMPSQVPPQQAPQQPAPAPGVQYPTPVPSQYPHQQQPAQQPAQQQPPPMQMAPPAQPGGLGPGQMIPQPAPMVQPTQMQVGAPSPSRFVKGYSYHVCYWFLPKDRSEGEFGGQALKVDGTCRGLLLLP